ncbi:MAG: HI0074 family nucleotidyltransferase substrate-binding subunit [bacterium]
MSDKFDALSEQFKKASARFFDVMKKKKDEFIRDSAIQRFEFTFELAWKCVKSYLEEIKGIKTFAPRDAISEAYRIHFIDDEKVWVLMLQTRNMTSHLYNEAMSEEVYSRLAQFVPVIKKLVKALG